MRNPSFRPCARSITGPARCGGFTLIELMVVVAILGVLASLAAPGFQSLIASQRVKAASSDLYTSLLLARSEAMKRGQAVNVVAGTGGWAAGWSVQTTIGGATADLQKQDALDSTLSVLTSGPTTISFASTGRPSSLSTGVMLTVYSSSNSSAAARCVALSLSGMPQITKDSDGNASNGCQ